jgi:Family of unknown function (DUF6314)
VGGEPRRLRRGARPEGAQLSLPDYLLGTWEVDRALEDAAAGAGRFRGRATFSRDGDGLTWVETGEMRLGGYAGPARRELRIVPADGAWEVRFADGRPFHRLDLSGGTWRMHHPCGADRYDGELEVLGPDAFALRWSVTGPAKAQRLDARYVRA